MDTEEWRLCVCVSEFERTVKFWTEEIIPSDTFSICEINTFNAQILEIRNFIQTKNQNQCRCSVALRKHKLHHMIDDFNILLEKLIKKYCFILFFRFLYDNFKEMFLLIVMIEIYINFFVTTIEQ